MSEGSYNAARVRVRIDGSDDIVVDRVVSWPWSEIETTPYANDRNSLLQRPGRHKAGSVVLERKLAENKFFYDWFRDVKVGRHSRRAGIIALLKPDGDAGATLLFFDCWPSAYGLVNVPTGTVDSLVCEQIVLCLGDWELQL